MFAKPQAEHQWLDQLVGKWDYEADCRMTPDGPPMNVKAKVTARSLGGLWVLIETAEDPPEGEPWSTLMTVGYDPVAQRYVGTFVGSMMTHLWSYTGQLDGDKRKLPLAAPGPRMDGTPGMANYVDSIEIIDADHWTLTSQVEGPDGQWSTLMTAQHRRVRS